MQIRYSPDADILLIRLMNEKLVDSVDITEGVIVHLSKENRPVEIEILDASKFVLLDDVDVSLKEILPTSGVLDVSESH